MISLEKYKGSKTRFNCPSCNGKRKFTRYKDDEGNYLDDNVGKCDRLSKCGYHYTPKQFYADNPDLRQKAKNNFLAKGKKPVTPARIVAQPKPDFIDSDILTSTLTDYEDNAFVKFLSDLFPDDNSLVLDAVRRYLIGSWRKNKTVFWQIDKNQKIRTGKLISYNAATGKRIKSTNPSYIHAELKWLGKLSDNFNLEQCLFGEHLLKNDRNKIVAIVEAEKTAVIASILFPDMIWLAAGAKSYLKVEKLEKVGNRNIILYPDGDAFEDWSKIAEKANLQGLNVKVSTLIETNGSETEKKDGDDLADYLVRQQRLKTKLNGKSYLIKLLPHEILCNEILLDEFVTVFDERIAVLEYENGLSSEEAEKAARQSESLKSIIGNILSE